MPHHTHIYRRFCLPKVRGFFFTFLNTTCETRQNYENNHKEMPIYWTGLDILVEPYEPLCLVSEVVQYFLCMHFMNIRTYTCLHQNIISGLIYIKSGVKL